MGRKERGDVRRKDWCLSPFRHHILGAQDDLSAGIPVETAGKSGEMPWD
jgi:hypothetical protein